MKPITIAIGIGAGVGVYFLLQMFNKRSLEPVTPGGVDMRNIQAQPSQIFPYRPADVNPQPNQVQTIGQRAYSGTTQFNMGPQIPQWLSDVKNTASFLDAGRDIISSVSSLYDDFGSWFGGDESIGFDI